MNRIVKMTIAMAVAVGAFVRVEGAAKTYDFGALIAKHFGENANPFYDADTRAYWGVCSSPKYNCPAGVLLEFESAITPGARRGEDDCFIGFRHSSGYPSVYVNSSEKPAKPSPTSSSVGTIESGECYLHPNNDANQGATIVFLPTKKGTYQFDFQIRSIESGGSVHIEVSDASGNVLVKSGSTSYGADSVVGTSGPLHLEAESACFIRIDNNGAYYSDASGFRLSVTCSVEIENPCPDEEIANLSDFINEKYRAGEQGSDFALTDVFGVEFCASDSKSFSLLDINIDRAEGKLCGRGLSTGLYNIYPRILANKSGEDVAFQGGEVKKDEIVVHPGNSKYSYVRFKALQPTGEKYFLSVDARDVAHGPSGGVVVGLFANDKLVLEDTLVDVSNARLCQKNIHALLPKLATGDTFGVLVRSCATNTDNDDTALRIALRRAKRLGGLRIMFY